MNRDESLMCKICANADLEKMGSASGIFASARWGLHLASGKLWPLNHVPIECHSVHESHNAMQIEAYNGREICLTFCSTCMTVECKSDLFHSSLYEVSRDYEHSTVGYITYRRLLRGFVACDDASMVVAHDNGS